jgi:hypothetical protein
MQINYQNKKRIKILAFKKKIAHDTCLKKSSSWKNLFKEQK